MLDSTGNHKRTSKPGGSLRQCRRWPTLAAISFRCGFGRYGTREEQCSMKVRDGMTRVVVSIGPAHTLREAAQRMSAQHVGAAVVVDQSHWASH